MKTLISAALTLLLLGCGSSGSQEEIVDPINPTKSNVGQNINSLGYYDNDTMFGNHKIIGLKAVYEVVGYEIDTNSEHYQREKSQQHPTAVKAHAQGWDGDLHDHEAGTHTSRSFGGRRVCPFAKVRK